MELWIRTQDRKKLLIVKEIELHMIAHQKLIKIWGGTKDNCRPLGEYTIEEKALQVMEEIQACIIYGGLPYQEMKKILEEKQINLHDKYVVNYTTGEALYIMPED